MATADYFSPDIDEARDKFFAACRILALRPEEIAGRGPFGGSVPLIDVVRLGDPAARRILVLGGGDRLADALVCSAIQIGWLREFTAAALPPDAAMVLLHHGAAPQTGGETPGDERPPPQWDSDLLTKVEERYAAYAREKGVDHTGAPLQTDTAAGGAVPGYASEVLDAVAEHLATARGGRITFIDACIGLGPYGEAAIIGCHPPTSPAMERIRADFALPAPAEDDRAVQGSAGCLTTGLMRRFADTQLTAIRMEFGTYSMLTVLDTLSTREPDRTVPDTEQLRNPDADDWRESVWRGAIMNIQRALTALHGP